MQASQYQGKFDRFRAETRLSNEREEDLLDGYEVEKEGEFEYNKPEEEIA